MPKIVTWEQYKTDIKQAYQGKSWTVVDYIEPWNGNKTKLRCICALHGEWKTTSINTAKLGRGCPECGREIISKAVSINKSKTWEQYKEEVQTTYNQAGKFWTVIGWHGEWKGWNTKLVCCCALHGEWRSTSISSAKNGSGCRKCMGEANRERTSIAWEKHKEEVEEAYKEKPWIVRGYVEPWNGSRTKLICECKFHGQWCTTTVNSAKQGTGCYSCQREMTKQRNTMEDKQHVEDFIKACPDNVERKYYRSDRVDRLGRQVYWIVECPICAEDDYCKEGLCDNKFEMKMSHLKRGGLPCRCSKYYHYTPEQWAYRMTKACQERGDQFIGFIDKVSNNSKFKYLCREHGEQTITPTDYLNGKGCPGCKNRNMQEFYINIILDEYGEDTGAYKLGIAKDSDIRIKGQNANNNYSMRRIALFDLPSYQACRALESKLKSKTDQILPSIGCVERLHMKDGHSETFLREDLAIVLSAINQAGGIIREEETC